MNIVITDISAIVAHRAVRCGDAAFRLMPALEPVETSNFGRYDRFRATVMPFLLQLEIMREGEPLHVHVSKASQRPRFQELIAHVRTTHLPNGSFWKVIPRNAEVARAIHDADINVFVDCPALCVLSRAAQKPKDGSKIVQRIYPVAKALALASEFCGKFSLNPLDPAQGEPCYHLAPVMSATSFAKYLESVSGLDGLTVARTVASLVANRQESIREVALYASIVLRPGLGGLHLPRPTTNKALHLNERQLSLIKHKELTPDLYWKLYRLVIEYDGSDHFTEAGAREDKRRVHDYQVLGLTVIPVTSEDLSGVNALDRLLKTIARHMAQVDGAELTHRCFAILRDRDYRNCRSVLLSTILSVE